MADGEVKISVGFDTDPKGADEAQRKLDDLNRKAEIPEQKSAPAPQPAARPQQGRSQTATEANAKNGAPDESERTAAKSARERAGEARKVSTESREQLTLEEKKQKIASLHKAADAYDARGDMDVAARSARADARVLERDVARDTKARAADEQRITREAKEQEAMRRAGIGVAGRRMASAAAFGQDILAGGATPGSASSAMLGAGMRTGNPLVMVTAVAAALATGLAGLLAKEQDKDTSQRLKFDENRANERFRSQRGWGVFGGSAALMSNSLAAEEDAAKRKAAEPGLKEKARFKWHDPSTWEWGGLRKNAGHREEEENENERIAAGIRAASEKKRAAARYQQTEGGLELETLRGRSKRSLSGQREAFVADEAGKAFAKYEEAKRQGASEDMAKEMATLTYQNDLRERQAQAGARLVSAKSGGAEISAAARWSMAGTPQSGDIGSKLDSLIGVVNRGNQEAGMEKLHK